MWPLVGVSKERTSQWERTARSVRAREGAKMPLGHGRKESLDSLEFVPLNTLAPYMPWT